MEDDVDLQGQPSKGDQSPAEDELLTLSTPLQGQPTAVRRRRRNPFATRKGALLSGLVLLIILSTSLLAFKALAKPGGIEKWSYRSGDYTPLAPIIANGMVYELSEDEPSMNGTLYALDASSGHEKWSYQPGSFVPLSPIIANGMVYVVSDGSDANGTEAEGPNDENYTSTVDALDAVSGISKWTYQTADRISPLSSPIIANGRIYILSENGNLDVLNALSGSKIWTKQMGGFAAFSPIVANDMVYVVLDNSAAHDSTVYDLDAASGHEKWSYNVGNITTAPLEAVNGIIDVT